MKNINTLNSQASTFTFFFLLGVKTKNPQPSLEGSVQNVELKYCSTFLVKCASGTIGSIKICAKAPGMCSWTI